MAVSVKVAAVFGMSFDPCQGRYLRVHNQLRTLASRGYDVTLLAWDRECGLPEEEERDGFRIRRIRIPAPVGKGPRRNAGNVVRFNRAVYGMLSREPPDIIHCFNLDAVLAAFLAARRRGKRLVLDLCEPEYYGLWSARYRWLLAPVNALERGIARRADRVFVHNRFQVRKFQGYGVDRLVQVGSYPNRSMIPRDVERPPRDVFVVGRLGTIYEDNGIEEMLEAYRLLLDRRRGQEDGTRYHLYLAGRVFERYRPTFERLVAPFGDRITVHGPFDAHDMPELYPRLDLSLVLARRTRWFRHITPTKLFDSMAAGVPVLGSDIGEVREILEEGEWGFIVDETDPASICDGIERVAGTPGLQRRMAGNALRLARERYTWEVYAPEFIRAYASLVDEIPGLRAGAVEEAPRRRQNPSSG
jgi:glycosyltransferase involved in cell wall biosynthesis